jgi:hypothetical protein
VPQKEQEKEEKKQGAYLCNLHVVYCPIDLEGELVTRKNKKWKDAGKLSLDFRIDESGLVYNDVFEKTNVLELGQVVWSLILKAQGFTT